jgi:succinate dehydrogenase / fumarate reductase, cytochrome b subunit|tara:strand:+ start:465 stop:839 length:375 start_codon:yes stop_codon:yes gene_type:complete
VNNKRPVNLDLFTIKQPLPAIASILHRISGIIVFVGIALLMYVLDKTLASEEGFIAVQSFLDGIFVKLILWGVLSALVYHLVAGFKHLLMDMGVGETLEGARIGAKLVLGVSAILIVLLGVSIW